MTIDDVMKSLIEEARSEFKCEYLTIETLRGMSMEEIQEMINIQRLRYGYSKNVHNWVIDAWELDKRAYEKRIKELETKIKELEEKE